MKEQPKINKPVGKTELDQKLEVFNEANQRMKELMLKIESGDFIVELISMSQGSVPNMKEGWKTLYAQARQAVENYNNARREVSDLLRQQVTLTPDQWRGPEGKSTTVKAGPFTAISITKRAFDAQSLFKLADQHGLLDRIHELEAVDKDGKKFKVVEEKWEIDYSSMYGWLRENNLDDVIQGAYNEVESTPQVRGPKELYFFGDEKKS